MASSDETSYQPVIVSSQGVRQAPQPPTPKELVDKYSGIGLQFRVKFVGCENVNRKRGDAEAARYCLPTLRHASKASKAHKPKAVLGLSLKGISLYDERSKSITRVPVDKITFVTHDPGDVCYFGCIIQTKESHTGFKMYCFKAEKPIATKFVICARELFDLMFKLRQAKKKLKDEREQADAQTANQNPDDHSLPPENAPPPSYVSVSSSTPPDRPPPPRPNQPPALPPRPEDEQQPGVLLVPPPQQPNKDKKQSAMDEWNQLEGELSDIAQDLNIGNQQNQLKPQPKKDRIPSYPPPAFEDLDDIFSQPPPPAGPPPPTQQNNPFGAAPPLPNRPPPTHPPSTQPPPPSQPPPSQFDFYTEPSITMDLMEAINKPMPGATTYNMGMGSSMPPGMGGPGMGGPGMGGPGMGMGGPGMGMGGPGMGGPGMGGPGMGGPGMGGPGMGGPGMGGPSMGMGGPGMGGPGMGGPSMGMGGPGPGMNQGNPFGNQPNNDIFSLPADPLLNTNFSQPLLPQSTAAPEEQPAGRKQSLDFSDLVTIARAKTAFEGGKKGSPMISSHEPIAEAVDTGGNLFGDTPSGNMLGDTSAPLGNTPTSSSGGGNLFGDDTFGQPPSAPAQTSHGFDDTFGSTTAPSDGFDNAFGSTAAVSTTLPQPQSNSWISF